jgi:ribosomal protein S18 acetylase RimI-like enzyme
VTCAPFSSSRIDLDGATLAPVDEDAASFLAARCASIDPWARMAYPEESLGAYFRRADSAALRRCIRVGDEIAGAVVVRHPWLKGPYVEFLAVLPPHQGAGIGSAIIDWIEREAGAGERNLWVLASDFNEGALRFYRRHGFEPVTRLPDLAADGFTEIMLRKRLFPVRR